MTSYTLSPVWGAGAQLFDNAGNVLTGGRIETYEAGTTTNAATYTDPLGNFFNSNPIIADASGRLSNEIWLPVSGAYKFVLKDANGVLIATYDNIPTIPQPPIVNDASSISYQQGYTVTAGAFTVGATYLITSVGTTNFVAIGAAANATGILFTATGVGSGTGTAEYSRTVQAKLREMVSVKDFGAVGDGVADDTAAIQAAINAVSDNSLILFPVGDYVITSTIAISKPVTLQGNQAKIDASSSQFTVLAVTASNVTINGLEIEGAGNASFNTNGRLITVTGVNNGASAAPTYIQNVTISNCYLHDSGRAGVDAEFVDNLTVIYNKIEKIGYAGLEGNSCINSKFNFNVVDDVSPGENVSNQAYGAYWSRTNAADTVRYPRTVNCEFCFNSISNVLSWEGLDTHGGLKIRFIGNNIINCGAGIICAEGDNEGGATVFANEQIVITDNTIANTTGSGIGFSNVDSPFQHTNITISGNTIDNAGPTANLFTGGIRITRANNVSITGNAISNARRAGIFLSASGYISVAGNTFRNIYHDINNRVSAVYAEAIDGLTVVGNTLDVTQVAPFTATFNNLYGLYLATDVTNVNAGRNYFQDATIRQYFLSITQFRNLEPARTQQGEVVVAVTTAASTFSTNVTLPSAYGLLERYSVIGSITTRDGAIGRVVVVVDKVDAATIEVSVQTANGSNFPANGNATVAWLTSGW